MIPNNNYEKIFSNKDLVAVLYLERKNNEYKKSDVVSSEELSDEIKTLKNAGIENIILRNLPMEDFFLNYRYRLQPSLGDVYKKIKESVRANPDMKFGISTTSNNPAITSLNVKYRGNHKEEHIRNRLNLTFCDSADYAIVDIIAGTYEPGYNNGMMMGHDTKVNMDDYEKLRSWRPDTVVIGGVHTSNYPNPKTDFEKDLRTAKNRAEGILLYDNVDLKIARKTVGNHPIISYGHYTPKQAGKVLSVADAVIIGNELRVKNNPQRPLSKAKLKSYVRARDEARNNK